MSEYIRSPELVGPDQSLVIVSDLQEKLMAVIPESERLVHRCGLLLQGAEWLNVPILGTEQYPQGLGPTVPALAKFLPNPPAKKRFSCVEALNLPAAGERADERFRAVVIGIETHVCVLQTAFDLQALGYEVLLPVDALASQQHQDTEIALRRMESAGMTLTTTQMLLLEWCETAEHPRFKDLSRLVLGRPNPQQS